MTATLTQPIKWHGVTLHPIPGCGGYAVSIDGRVWSCWRATGRPDYQQQQSNRWRTLKPSPRKEDGRKRYTLRRDDGTYRRCYASHLVLEAFVGPCPAGMEACHNNGDCTDDSAGNLRWDTPISNKADMKRHGTQVAGETHPKAKLSDQDVRAILDFRAAGYSHKRLAEHYGVSVQRIHQITKKGGR